MLGRCESEERVSETRTLAYVGPQDVRYAVLMLGAVKAGYTLQTFHPATPAEYCISLLQHTGCRYLLFDESVLPVVYSILSAQPMTVLAVPSVASFLPTSTVESVQPMPFSKTLAEVYSDPFYVAHTSGTTGPPKPIILTHGAFVSGYSSFCKIASGAGGGGEIAYANFHGLRVLFAAPISILAGLYHLLGFNLVYDYIVALPPPWMVMTPLILDQIHMHAGVQVTIGPPSISER